MVDLGGFWDVFGLAMISGAWWVYYFDIFCDEIFFYIWVDNMFELKIYSTWPIYERERTNS